MSSPSGVSNVEARAKLSSDSAKYRNGLNVPAAAKRLSTPMLQKIYRAFIVMLNMSAASGSNVPAKRMTAAYCMLPLKASALVSVDHSGP